MHQKTRQLDFGVLGDSLCALGNGVFGEFTHLRLILGIWSPGMRVERTVGQTYLNRPVLLDSSRRRAQHLAE
ncbi:hypothetical protein DPMN_069684 [Dreissena polymorpha]|uniref:Uncharacterized protein n=1 Tax=Dreissena polymorpha TaxID=45954 RepID=A0A9D3YZH1_DREPO|nr:hypothetical protein DPMN_069684 [Dreissena polymorpha]